jgi:zinc protease
VNGLTPFVVAFAAAAVVASDPSGSDAAAAQPSAATIAPFPEPSVATLPNGAVIVSQPSGENPIVDVQTFYPAGLAQQPSGKSGVAAVAAAVVLRTPVERSIDVADIATSLGASVTYTVDPQDTRFSIECRASDLPRLIGDLASAVADPDPGQIAVTRKAAMSAASAAVADPVLVAYSMVRQAQYQGTPYADPDEGRAISLSTLAPADVTGFIGRYRTGHGAAVSLAGDVTSDDIAAAQTAVAGFAAGPPVSSSTPAPSKRGAEVVARRDIPAPWVAVGYSVPDQFSPDFPAMLVIEALLGRGGDVHAFDFGPGFQPPDDFIGGYYQYEAEPGTLIEFYSGANVDQDLHDLSDAVTRLRTSPLSADLLARARQTALGEFLTSVSTLDDRSWLLGRCVLSPAGAALENQIPTDIATVSAAQLMRVANSYLAVQTVAVVLPSNAGQ